MFVVPLKLYLISRAAVADTPPPHPSPASGRGSYRRRCSSRSAPRESSLRKQGPIPTGGYCCPGRWLRLSLEIPRRMGPCFRRDDAEVILTNYSQSDCPTPALPRKQEREFTVRGTHSRGSSLRKQGPIPTGGYCCPGRWLRLSLEIPRRMGPCFRRDDAEVILTNHPQSACLGATASQQTSGKQRHVPCAGHRSGHHILARDRVSCRHLDCRDRAS